MNRIVRKMLLPIMTAMVFTAVSLPVSAQAATTVTSTWSSPSGIATHRVIACPADTVCLAPTKGNKAYVDVDLKVSYLDITELCFTLNFTGNLLDPGEEYYIQDVGGKVNTGTAPLSSGTTCANSTDHPDLLEEFLDGCGQVKVFMANGSAQLTRKVGITVTGTR